MTLEENMGLSSAASNGNVSEWVYFKAENPQTWDILAPVMIGWSVLYRFNSSNIPPKDLKFDVKNSQETPTNKKIQNYLIFY